MNFDEFTGATLSLISCRGDCGVRCLACFVAGCLARHVRCDCGSRRARGIAVIFLDWSGVDPRSNPLHPASKLFDSRSSMELQCIYILNIERLGVSVVL